MKSKSKRGRLSIREASLLLLLIVVCIAVVSCTEMDRAQLGSILTSGGDTP